MTTRGSANPSYRFDFGAGVSTQGATTRLHRADDGQGQRRFRYFLNDQPLALSAGRVMFPGVADLIDVFTMVRIADGLGPRAVRGDIRSPAERWHRRMHVIAPVRCPDLWRSAAVSALLADLLLHVSDDDWSFEFTRRSDRPRPSEGQRHLFPRVGGASPLVLLHSGGLDSLFGLIAAATGVEAAAVLAVSVTSHPRHRRVTEDVLAALQGGLPPHAPSIGLARLHLHASRAGRRHSDREPSQRTRGPMFIAAGIAAAVLGGASELRLTENGIGAVNLPYLPDQVGARATKATHPRTLALMARLASIVLNQPIMITNAGLFRTKGQLGHALLNDRFLEAARRTVSCERFPYAVAREACGRCSSCVMRRISLNASGLSELDAGTREYGFDPLLPGADWSEKDVAVLFAMRELVERLREALARADPRRSLIGAFPMLDDLLLMANELGMGEAELEARLVQLFQAYVAEFDAYAGEIDQPGWRRATISRFEAPVTSAIAG